MLINFCQYISQRMVDIILILMMENVYLFPSKEDRDWSHFGGSSEKHKTFKLFWEVLDSGKKLIDLFMKD